MTCILSVFDVRFVNLFGVASIRTCTDDDVLVQVNTYLIVYLIDVLGCSGECVNISLPNLYMCACVNLFIFLLFER